MKNVKFLFVGVFMMSALISCKKDLINNEGSTETTFTESTPVPVCETAFARKENALNYKCFLNLGFQRWGWTNGPLAEWENTYYLPLYASASKCTDGTQVGYVSIVYGGGVATVTFKLYDGFSMSETHLYIGNVPLPKGPNGKNTVAPGQYPFGHTGLDGIAEDVYVVEGLTGNIYVIAHAIVCGF